MGIYACRVIIHNARNHLHALTITQHSPQIFDQTRMKSWIRSQAYFIRTKATLLVIHDNTY